MKKLVTAVLFCSVFFAGCGKEEPDHITARTWVTEVTPSVTESAFVTEKPTVTKAPAESVTEAPEKPVPGVSFTFDTCADAPVLSGEQRELDWSMIFAEDCMVIGEETYPAYIKICDLSSNFKLGVINLGDEHPDNPDMLCDYYILYCLDKKVCGIIATREPGVEPKDAYISVWTLGGFDEVPKNKLGLMGFSLAQSTDEVAEGYRPDERDGNVVKYYGVTEANGERFACTLSHSDSFATMLTITPYEVNPSAYLYYADK